MRSPMWAPGNRFMGVITSQRDDAQLRAAQRVLVALDLTGTARYLQMLYFTGNVTR